MSLDLGRLENIHRLDDGSIRAACPSCRELGGDKSGNHLLIRPDERYGCAARPGDREHRSRIWQLAGDGNRPVGSRPRVLVTADRRAALERQAEHHRRRILSAVWLVPEIEAASPAPVPEEPAEQARALLQLFPPGDWVWTGGLLDSGGFRHALRFRPVREWLRPGTVPGPRICACAFHPHVVSRTLRTVRRRRFLVVESDSLSFGEQGALIRWLRAEPSTPLGGAGLRLRAVVHSGGRSLHAWFDAPPEREVESLRAILPPLGADPALFSASQPVRVPGWLRSDNGRLPRLLFLDLR